MHSTTIQRGMSLKVWRKTQTTIRRPLAAFKDAMIIQVWFTRCKSMQFNRPRPWGTAMVASYVICMTWPLQARQHSRPWTMNHLAHLSPPFWSWNYTRLLSLISRHVAMILERFLITQPYWNCWTSERMFLITQYVIPSKDIRQYLQRRYPQNCLIILTSMIPVRFADWVRISCTPSKTSDRYHIGKWWHFSRSTVIALTAWSQEIFKQCPCGKKCRKYQKPHHTWLHIDKEARKQTKRVSDTNRTPGTVIHHLDLLGCHPVVLMTCHIQIVSADSSTTNTRTVLESASSTLFIMESFSTVPTFTTSCITPWMSLALAVLQPNFHHTEWWISTYPIIVEKLW